MSNPPSVTLYVTNLNDKVKKPELRRTLYALFSVYGKVLDVVHTRALKTRGTAFVVFRDLAASTAALRGLDGEGYFGKQLRITYALSTSHATIAQSEGPEAVYAIKLGLRTAAEKKAAGQSKLTVSGAQKKAIDEAKGKRAREEREAGGAAGEEEESDEEENEEEGEGRERKKGKIAQEEEEVEEDDAMEEGDSDDEAVPSSAAAAASAALIALATAEQGETPNPILFVEGLPVEITADMLLPLFQQYPGLSSLKLLPTPSSAPANAGLAFVQYETAGQAGTAKEALDDFLLAPGAPMKVGWAKRA